MRIKKHSNLLWKRNITSKLKEKEVEKLPTNQVVEQQALPLLLVQVGVVAAGVPPLPQVPFCTLWLRFPWGQQFYYPQTAVEDYIVNNHYCKNIKKKD